MGKADKVLEILQQNFAIAWLMITMVEIERDLAWHKDVRRHKAFADTLDEIK